MDFEKKYEEALERAKMFKGRYPTRGKSELIDAIFPELVESEDERIRMALRDIVRDMPYMETELRAHGLTVEKTLAYLEKQKEQKPAEQNPASGNSENPNSHAEWSEEEKRDIRDASDCLRDYANICMPEGNPKLYVQSLADRIESLRPLPKQEWSEDDKVRCESSIKHLEGYANVALSSLVPFIKNDIDWLKSIRPQPHWKPSEEQMEALSEILESCRGKHYASTNGRDAFIVAWSLYNDLKNL